MKRFCLPVLALFVCAAAPLSAQSKKGAAVPSTDDYNQSQFWIGNFPEGQYVVHLSRIVAVAQHKYILDNACMVYEVTLITLGNTPTKFYYLETLGQNSGINVRRSLGPAPSTGQREAALTRIQPLRKLTRIRIPWNSV